MNRYEHRIIDVMATLAETASGTRGGLQQDVLDELAAWLQWRVEEVWEPTNIPMMQDYEAAIRHAAREALRLYKATLPA